MTLGLILMYIAHDFQKPALQWQEQVLTPLIESYSMLH